MNDNQFSLAGNIVRDPVLKKVGDNKSVVSFRVAATARRFDPSLNDWRNLDTLYLTVNCWNKLAERVAGCLKGGDPVLVTGRLRMRNFDVETERRTVYEIDAQHVSPDLNRVAVQLVRVNRGGYPAEVPAVRGSGDAVPAMPQPVSTGPLVPDIAAPAA